MQKAWWKEAVVYQIYPRSFQDSTGNGIGDLKGITSRLDYLKELGVNVVWLSPCYKSPNDDNGYDISDYRDIMDDFGTMADWEEMLKGMHERGIKLVMDLVVNHSSDEHPWFIESRSSKDNPKRDYYIWRDGKNGGPPNNWTSFFSGSTWTFDEHTGQYYLHLFSKKQPDLNWENPQVRKEIYDMMNYWFEKGIDGFRLDAITYISKVSGLPDGTVGDNAFGKDQFANGPRIHEFMQEMNRECFSKYDCITVGECPDVSPEEALKYTGFDRHEIQMGFQFELMDVDSGPGTKFNIIPFDLVKFKAVQTRWQKGLEGKGWNSIYLCNHDQPRSVSRYGNDSPEFRKVSAKMLATMNHTLQGTPYIYQGEEIGMTNVPFKDISEFNDLETVNFWNENVLTGKMDKDVAMNAFRAKSRDNARTPMQWDATPNAGFTTGKPWLPLNPNYPTINVEESLKDKDSVFYYYQKLIQLRHQHDIIVYGTYDVYYPEDKNIYVYTRTLNDQKLFVALNFTQNEQALKIPEGLNFDGSKLLISNYPNNDSVPTKLRPYEAIVYLK
ncbi:Oligo-1,6-glucosidase [Tritrichomonas foetus]|uniref:Oligo-1,6-glucosidase n=1 Tax=Tritrichomonas foetus TaxID=1144522 RepID=A0A1J4KR11_9EUKA|nr:Oligo-1,6-glucosidase [Tritrichomonas foetus]OHT13691.1 Oligo-1,6-glucosidase [Tritrichomonas foetus]|eukprot:OHT13690.1 Oligo-1,6-glucosidase [Tritrichomonas foetus]